MPQAPTIDCNKIDCGESLLSNYSSEGAEPYPPYYAVVYPPLNPPPLDQEWSMPGCLYVCKSYISQEDANLCALRQSILCIDGPPGEEIWYSAPATCSANCPDGTVFYYTVPAGMFIARTYAEALAQAQAFACLRAQEDRFCIQEPPRCACTGNIYSVTISTDVGRTGLTWTIVGSLPPGLTLTSTSTAAIISGIPILKGTYAFQIVATDANGNYAIKVVTIQVVAITTTALDDFIIGTPYSYQLTADGGSGNYSWRVATGTLPDGLTISTSGLISGTPTVSATGGTLTFEVIDLTCEEETHQFFTPRIRLTTIGTTTVKTKRGWPEYVPSTGALYKTMSWTGFQLQLANTAGSINPFSPVEFCAGARYTYSGYSQIDINGNFIATHNKILTAACSKQPFPGVDVNLNFSLSSLLGYCWTPDPGSCSTCSADEGSWVSMGNRATHSQFDFPGNMIQLGQYASSTPTTWNYNSVGLIGGLALLVGVQNFPETTYNFTHGPWASIGSQGVWSVTLSDEYTDADATASQVVYSNSSSVAENLPNFRSWTYNDLTNRSSRVTVVHYELHMTNLVAGQNYIARVEYWSSGSHASIPYAFTAVGTTHTINAVVPTPASNRTITVKSPSIVFA